MIIDKIKAHQDRIKLWNDWRSEAKRNPENCRLFIERLDDKIFTGVEINAGPGVHASAAGRVTGTPVIKLRRSMVWPQEEQL